jgi:hypothetical protein
MVEWSGKPTVRNRGRGFHLAFSLKLGRNLRTDVGFHFTDTRRIRVPEPTSGAASMLLPFPTRQTQTPTESFIVNLPADIWPRVKNGELIFEFDEASGACIVRPSERGRTFQLG